MVRTYRFLAILAALAAPFVAHPARAGIAACGNINIEATANCKAEVGVDCTAKCTPVSFEAACHGELEASCDGQCNATLPTCPRPCANCMTP